jgi:AraC-like DNA-binding protein
MSISEIAEEVGYSSSGSLINLFVKKVGSSPGQYRKSHKTLKR